MRSFTLITALLLCSLSSVSGSESQTVEVQSGDEVTLTCNNIASGQTQMDWFRLINRTKPSCISSMYGCDGNVSYCVGFQKEKFEMSSNKSTVFLKIKRVDLSDSGLYFCGFYVKAHTVIADATHLIVQGDGESDGEVDFKTEKEFDGTANLMSLILGGLTVSLTIVVVVLAVKVRKLQTAVNEEPQPERNKNMDSDELNYAALSFQAKPKRSRRPAPEREMEPHVVYAATR
ncbi:uncharacterized protein LOC119481567 isoform X2 [Sebastes umbrosus]|uniref:uncharacterized protein LOC119481567 isoform X2 n=1 Tax=Sebastes umbrosus TaxID=72105 RepID=UPI00189ED2C8|nr:uncharacterized protein LOC119481567 isoform X2 [Sebastes umbrosus]